MSFQAWATSWSAYTVATSGRIVPSSSSRAILPSTSPDGASRIISPDTRWLAANSGDTGWVAETRWPPSFKTRNDRYVGGCGHGVGIFRNRQLPTQTQSVRSANAIVCIYLDMSFVD